MSNETISIMTNISFYAELIAFFGIIILGIYLLFSKDKYPKLSRVLIWSIIFLFFNFFTCATLFDISYQQ